MCVSNRKQRHRSNNSGSTAALSPSDHVSNTVVVWPVVKKCLIMSQFLGRGGVTVWACEGGCATA